MPTEKEVYEQHAVQYERLIRREDYQNNLLKAIEQLCPLAGRDVIDLGAGTGRLARLLAPRVSSVRAYDASAHMLEACAQSLRKMGLSNWETAVADHRHIPAADSSADLLVSGWSFCYLAVWGGESWEEALENGLTEIRRVLKPGGIGIIIETQGTGREEPNPPESLENYFAWLKRKGFESSWIRTDYRFESLAEAVELSTFFFGEEMGREVREKNWQVLPECTGLWWIKN
jgi:ubiquinone/menaquinone biosynthesis C-methylase UbiE